MPQHGIGFLARSAMYPEKVANLKIGWRKEWTHCLKEGARPIGLAPSF
jgi:hypothetical protein